MNRENQHVVVGRPTQVGRAVERPLHEVEWRAENLCCQFFNRFRLRIFWRNFAKFKVDPATLANRLECTFFARKERETKNFLTIDHSLDRSATLSLSQESVHIDQTADVIRVVLRRYRGDFPKFSLWESQRMKLGFTAIEPLFETSALVDRHRGYTFAGI
jgi:hypothetical protein